MKRREAGFSFIEILVVMGIISVLVSMVVVLVPMIQERSRRTKAADNVKNIITLMVADNATAEVGKWPRFNGKNFVLWVIATNKVDKSKLRNLEMLFSPGDGNYTMKDVTVEKYKDVTLQALQAGSREDFLPLTSWAGRRNKEPGHKLTASALQSGVIVVCDDDDGPVHHKDGMVVGYSDGSAKFLEWADIEGLSPPEDSEHPEGLLGDNSPNEDLKHMSSGN